MVEVNFQTWIREVKNDISLKSTGCCFIWDYTNIDEAISKIKRICNEKDKQICISDSNSIQNFINDNTFDKLQKKFLNSDVIILKEMQAYKKEFQNTFLDVITYYMSNNKTVILFARETFDYESILPKSKDEILAGRIYQYKKSFKNKDLTIFEN